MHFAESLADVVVPTPEQTYAPDGLLFTPTTDGEVTRGGVGFEWQSLTQYPDPRQSFVRIASRGQVLYHIRLGIFLSYDRYRTCTQDDDQLCLSFMEWQPLYHAVQAQMKALTEAAYSTTRH